MGSLREILLSLGYLEMEIAVIPIAVKVFNL